MSLAPRLGVGKQGKCRWLGGKNEGHSVYWLSKSLELGQYKEPQLRMQFVMEVGGWEITTDNEGWTHIEKAFDYKAMAC